MNKAERKRYKQISKMKDARIANLESRLRSSIAREKTTHATFKRIAPAQYSLWLQSLELRARAEKSAAFARDVTKHSTAVELSAEDFEDLETNSGPAVVTAEAG